VLANRIVPLTDDEKKKIAPYISNLEGDVFALAGLPEEVIAVLFAYYSRSKEDLRTNLAKLLADQDLEVAGDGKAAPQFRMASEKAKAFHEKWVVGYGHASVAEHAVVHLAIENVSIVTSKLIEDLRLASYTEKSTRYVLFDTASFHPLPELPPRERALYEKTAASLFTTYLDLVPKVETEVRKRHARGEKQTEGAYNAVVRAKTFDLLRGLLPAGTKTNIGLTANARALETLLSKMLSSPLAEAREVGTRMLAECASVAPTLVKYVAPSEYRKSLRDRMPELAAAHGIVGSDESEDTDTYGQSVRLLRWDRDAIERIVHALTYDGSDAKWAAHGLAACIGRISPSKLEAILKSALEGRGKFDPVPRAFEASTLAFELTMDFGAYRDLQRHRMLSPFTQKLSCSLGPEIPRELDTFDKSIGEAFRNALSDAESAYQTIAATHPWEAQYVVPLAFRLRTMWQMNVRELFHVVELRSAKQGHTSYRKIAQRIYLEAVKVMPWFKDTARVDMNDYDLARE
jgi:thymidylate synthase ThyX